ncbi:hypothetical protein Hamer_G017399 [Homarus americanus]|uniref:Uncharacterized protein n=1 Tax=Homarus americanus TaxID=6706 RepID=A0A8J5JS52_HOMAM|nr:hypothetical protein Hamer_G017399 [Homarus americanus]
METSQSMREAIIILHNGGYRKAHIARQFGASNPTVAFGIWHYEDSGSIDNQPRSGHPHYTAPEEDQYANKTAASCDQVVFCDEKLSDPMLLELQIMFGDNQTQDSKPNRLWVRREWASHHGVVGWNPSIGVGEFADVGTYRFTGL